MIRNHRETAIRNRKIDEQNIPTKDKTIYKQSISFLKDIGYLGLDFFKGYGQLVNKVEYASRLGEFSLAKRAGMLTQSDIDGIAQAMSSQKVTVTESDITGTQKRINVLQSRASF